MNSYDFGGWATRYNVRCSDGRTISHNAFKHCDDTNVPLVWNHNYSGPEGVIGKATLKHFDDGVYAYCQFNDTDTANTAKSLVKHGDITALSIYANKLNEKGGYVNHGVIREVSLVLAGANPGASIQEVLLHGEEDTTAALIYNDEIELDIDPILKHADKPDESAEKDPEPTELEHAEKEEPKAKTVAEIYDSMTEEQKEVVAIIADQLLQEGETETENNNENDEEDNDDMKHNVFENKTEGAALQHGEILANSIKEVKKYGTLKESVIAHAEAYGVSNIEELFPVEKNVTNEPTIYDNDQTWVAKFFNGTKKSPFSKLKAVHADTRGLEARAKGYTKGALKKEEVFSLLKRTTAPTTVYKKQKLDRDDILDITDFDVVSWMKREMRMKLNEELARAMLIGDGRTPLDEDKIKEANIRPIFNDSDLYTIKATLGTPGARGKGHEFIRTVIKAMAEYEGEGVPTLFIEPAMLADLLLIEDGDGRFMYDSVEVLARTLRVKEIVEVPLMKGLKRDDKNVLGIVVNPADYTVGADRGGQVAMFEDFDIDYNQQKYLMETRCSGSLLKPKTAISIEEATA